MEPIFIILKPDQHIFATQKKCQEILQALEESGAEEVSEESQKSKKSKIPKMPKKDKKKKKSKIPKFKKSE